MKTQLAAVESARLMASTISAKTMRMGVASDSEKPFRTTSIINPPPAPQDASTTMFVMNAIKRRKTQFKRNSLFLCSGCEINTRQNKNTADHHRKTRCFTQNEERQYC